MSRRTVTEFLRREGDGAVGHVLLFALLITIICVFVPFSPAMPRDGLDPSWIIGMNQATGQRFSFGEQIIFTFGPYASIYTRAYHPSTDLMMLGGTLFLSFAYCGCFFILRKNIKWRWVLAFCMALAGLTHSQDALSLSTYALFSRDTLLFSLPLLVGLSTFKAYSLEDGRLLKSRLAPLYFAFLFAALGLLPLVKGSLSILCGAVAVLCALFFIINRRRLFAFVCVFAPAVSMPLFWIASGQNIANLPTYFIRMASIVSGYTEAMSVVNGDFYGIAAIVLYLVASVLILAATLKQFDMPNTSKAFLFCIYFIYLFLAFKAGFVRHDSHATISGTSILMAALLLPFVVSTTFIRSIVIIALLTWAFVDFKSAHTSPKRFAENVMSTYSLAWNGIKNRIEDKNWPRSEFDAALKSLKEKADFPVLQGTTDIYSSNQSSLISSGNAWSPRPILQSYSAYTPELAAINRNHLLTDQAPDNVIFKVEPLDERFPSIEDGSSWPILMLNYCPTRIVNDNLFLRKMGAGREINNQLATAAEKHRLGERFNLPHASQPLFAQIDIQPSILGRMASFFFKPSKLQIKLELKDGTKREFRIVSGMAKSGFLISPLIENTTEFGMLYGKGELLDGKLVQSIEIEPRGGMPGQWNAEYSMIVSEIGAMSQTTCSNVASQAVITR
jgi:hypothetical protein